MIGGGGGKVLNIIIPFNTLVVQFIDVNQVLVYSTGQPYNQLAILASGKGDELATVYYYCRRYCSLL